MREQFHTEWERAVKNKMMWIAVFIGCLLAIAQTVFEVYPYARNPLMFYRGSDGQPASLFMYWFGLNSGSLLLHTALCSPACHRPNTSDTTVLPVSDNNIRVPLS